MGVGRRDHGWMMCSWIIKKEILELISRFWPGKKILVSLEQYKSIIAANLTAGIKMETKRKPKNIDTKFYYDI